MLGSIVIILPATIKLLNNFAPRSTRHPPSLLSLDAVQNSEAWILSKASLPKEPQEKIERALRSKNQELIGSGIKTEKVNHFYSPHKNIVGFVQKKCLGLWKCVEGRLWILRGKARAEVSNDWRWREQQQLGIYIYSLETSNKQAHLRGGKCFCVIVSP